MSDPATRRRSTRLVERPEVPHPANDRGDHNSSTVNANHRSSTAAGDGDAHSQDSEYRATRKDAVNLEEDDDQGQGVEHTNGSDLSTMHPRFRRAETPTESSLLNSLDQSSASDQTSDGGVNHHKLLAYRLRLPRPVEDENYRPDTHTVDSEAKIPARYQSTAAPKSFEQIAGALQKRLTTVQKDFQACLDTVQEDLNELRRINQINDEQKSQLIRRIEILEKEKRG